MEADLKDIARDILLWIINKVLEDVKSDKKASSGVGGSRCTGGKNIGEC